ncbi:MAG: hypothetical protein WBF25_03195 [Terriglobales bacterium]
MNLLELSYQRKKAKAEASGLLDKAVAESRTLTIAEQVQFDALTVRIHVLDEQFAQRESLRKVVA